MRNGNERNGNEIVRQARYSLVFATADEGMILDSKEQLAAAFTIQIASDSTGLFKAIQENAPEMLALDLDTMAGDEDFFAFIRSVRAKSPDGFLLAISRRPLSNARRRAKEAGSDEYLLAPIDFPELRAYLLEAGARLRRERESQRLRKQVQRKTGLGDMIGGSEPMQRVYEALRRVAPSNTTVMIRGESGTGKELAARAVVSLSPRHNAPFISVNCAALPETLMESELFGHEKGSFTGAHAARPGQIELADGGTLFLDEIGSLGMTLQSKLLRVLQDRQVQRIGAKQPRKIDFRLITATNDNLEEMVKAGHFREDLYYRISVIPVSLPPLRERAGDIPLLLDHYLRLYCKANQLEPKRISAEAMDVLETSTWPGNVRELENLAQRLVLMVDGDLIAVEDLPERVIFNSTTNYDQMLVPMAGVHLEDELRRIEIAYLEAALRRAGTKNGAASLLRIPVQKMKYLCRKHGLSAAG